MTQQSPDQSLRGLLVLILIISGASFSMSVLQVALTLRGVLWPATAHLPVRYSARELSRIAATFTEPYNRNDADFIYNKLDEVAKVQLGHDKVIDAVAKLRAMMGRIDSATYESFKELPQVGESSEYVLNYGLKLSGRDISSGLLQIYVMDRPSGPSFMGFYMFTR